MKVEKSFNKKTNIPLSDNDSSILKTYAKFKDHKIGRLDKNGYREFDGNIRFIEVIKALDSKESLVADQLGVSVSVVSGITSLERTTPISLAFIGKLRDKMPFLNSNYIEYNYKVGHGNPKMFSRTWRKKASSATKISTSVLMPACDRFEQVRKSAMETQVDFANKLGVVRATVVAIAGRRQNPTLNQIIALSERYGVSINWIVTGKGEMYGDGDNGSSGTALADAKKKIRTLEETVARQNKIIDKLTV
jgi:DNA-binding XRE family transcriptional regulator